MGDFRTAGIAGLLGCAWFLASSSLPGRAETSPVGEKPVVEKVGDWELACGSPTADGKKPACRLVQNHAAETGATVLLVTIVQDAAKFPVAVVSVPEGVYLAPGIELTVDKGQSFKLLYETCNSSGCHAGFKIAGDIAAALKKGQIAHHKLFDSKQTPVTIDVSLKGLSKALDRLQEASP